MKGQTTRSMSAPGDGTPAGCPLLERMTVVGASRPLRRIPAIVSFLNPQPAVSLVGGNRSSCPFCDLRASARPAGGFLAEGMPSSGQAALFRREMLVEQLRAEDAVDAEAAEILTKLAPGADQADIAVIGYRDRRGASAKSY